MLGDDYMGPQLRPIETAKALNISLPTLARMRSEESGPPFVRLRGSIRYDEDLLAEWLKQRTKSK